MNDLKILDSYVNDMEFRNYIHGLLIKNDFKRVRIDDVTLCDDDDDNDNDLIAFKDGQKYTIQTYLNRSITMDELEETKKDIINEKVKGAIIITNKGYDKDVSDFAKKNHIIIWDREQLKKLIENANEKGNLD